MLTFNFSFEAENIRDWSTKEIFQINPADSEELFFKCRRNLTKIQEKN